MTKRYVKTIILIAILILTFIVSPLGIVSAKKSDLTNVEEFNIWLSNPVKEGNSVVVIAFPSKIKTPFCFLIYLRFPDIISFGIIEDYEKETNKIKREEIRKIIVSNTYVNGIPFKELEYPIVSLYESNTIAISGLFPYKSEFNEIRFYFSELLKISFKSSGEYTINARIYLPPELYANKLISNKFIIFDTLP